MIGHRFGSLVVFSRLARGLWSAQCDCGRQCAKITSKIKKAKFCSLQCPLFRRSHSVKVARHGMYRHPAYSQWRGMFKRCEDSNNPSYEYYGGRGISVSENWESFEYFWRDMGPTWKEGLTLDRIDTDGNYGPGNCRWTTPKHQARNRRNNHLLVTPSGEMSIAEAAELFHMPRARIAYRLRRGWPIDKILLPINSFYKKGS